MDAARSHELEHPLDCQDHGNEPERGEPHRSETFKLSKDPLFIEKVRVMNHAALATRLQG